jgi:probable F420-dependent oxidoreductase
MRRSFRFGLQLAEALSKQDWVRQVHQAEDLGYDIVVLPDHVGDQLSPFAALVSAGEASEKLRLGTFVLDNDFRHPLLLAQEAATVDLLTEGRLELGLGAGWMGQDYERLRMEFASPGERLGRLKETVEIIDLYFTGEPFSFEGRHYEVGEHKPSPVPTQDPRPPLLIGGGGQQILEFAAKKADIVSVFLTSHPDGSGFDSEELRAETHDRKIAQVLAAAGERADSLELNVLLQYFEITNDRAGVASEHAEELGTDRDDLLALPFELIGTLDQIVEDLLTRRERFGISYITVFDKYMEEFAPVIERLRDSD